MTKGLKSKFEIQDQKESKPVQFRRSDLNVQNREGNVDLTNEPEKAESVPDEFGGTLN